MFRRRGVSEEKMQERRLRKAQSKRCHCCVNDAIMWTLPTREHAQLFVFTRFIYIWNADGTHIHTQACHRIMCQDRRTRVHVGKRGMWSQRLPNSFHSEVCSCSYQQLQLIWSAGKHPRARSVASDTHDIMENWAAASFSHNESGVQGSIILKIQFLSRHSANTFISKPCDSSGI